MGGDVIPRVDASGRAFKGSQLQTQIYVNERPAELSEAIVAEVAALDGAHLTWVAPLEANKFREPRDAEFLDVLGRRDLLPSSRAFWPSGGPVWDGLAKVKLSGNDEGLLLLEAKSYPQEMRSACRARRQSRRRIEVALSRTRSELGAPEGCANAWIDSYYQLANRLAHLLWLRRAGAPAWLILLCILDDEHHIATTRDAWDSGLADVRDELGIDVSAIEGVAHIFLVAQAR